MSDLATDAEQRHEIQRLNAHIKKQDVEVERLRTQCGGNCRYWEGRWRDEKAENERLLEIGNATFIAMCAFRDNNDDEAFSDAIDALGATLKDRESAT